MKPKNDIAIAYNLKRRNRKKLAMGGHIEEMEMPKDIHESDEAEMHVEELLRRKKMAEGGMLDDRDDALEENAMISRNMEDDLSYDALRKEMYAESSALKDASSPEDSNLHGDEDEESIVTETAKRMRERMRK